MTDFATLAQKTPVNVCAALGDLTDSSRVLYKSWQLGKISGFLKSKGFDSFEYVGKGSNAFVFAPTDNSDIVLRVSHYPGDHRSEIPVMLQPIGEPLRLATTEENGKIYGGYRVEFLKKLDMSVDDKDLKKFLREAKNLGYRIHSLARGSEIGWYNYQNSATRGERRVLMGADPSSLGKGEADGLARKASYPSLEEQYRENLRIAKADKRLNFLIPEIEKQIETAPICRIIKSQDMKITK